MHNYNNEEEGAHKGMMWMIIPCLLIVGFLFLGGDQLASPGYLWPILIGFFIVVHIWMTLKGGVRHEESTDKSAENSKEKIK